MATDLTRLRVSLTKHGAHKIAYLVSAFDKDEIINHLDGDYRNINIDQAQTRKILSIEEDGKAPSLWNDIKKFGEEDISDVVFFAIVLSHHELIEAIIQAFEDGAVVHRGEVIDDKTYTNFARIIEDLGFAVEHTKEYVAFDITRIFYKFYLTRFIYDLIGIKLRDAGWDEKVELEEECIRLSLNKVFDLTAEDFRLWIKQPNINKNFANEITRPKRNFENGIQFVTGHRAKFEGFLEYEVSNKRRQQLIHNKIQTKLYNALVKLFPDDEIGTEVKTNIGSVDLVRKMKNGFVFYEIKTANNIRLSIRQALAQLLEYAYWNEIDKVYSLIVIAPNKPTKRARIYLNKLRSSFGLPLYFQFFDLKENRLYDAI